MNSIILLFIQIIAIKAKDCKNSVSIDFASREAYHLGEGPFWDDRTGSLWHVNTFVGDMCHLNVTTGLTEKLSFNDYISIVIPILNTKNRFIVSRRNTLLEVDWDSRTYLPIADVGPEKFNDAKVDAKGRLWIGSLRNTDYYDNSDTIPFGGALYRLDGRRLTRMDTYTLPNGMAWSADNTKYYCVDTVERQIYVYDFDLNSGTIYNKRVLLDFNTNPEFGDEELPDGMSIDINDNIWVAVIFGDRLILVDTKTGEILRSLPTPANQTSSIAFGGPDYKDMYVTTGWRNLNEIERRLNPNIGRVLRITADFICGAGPANRVILY